MSTNPDPPELTPTQLQRGVISIFYEGPWDRLMNWLYGIDRKTNEIRVEIKEGGIRERLAGWAEARHFAWTDRYIAKGQYPPDRWKRRVRQ